MAIRRILRICLLICCLLLLTGGIVAIAAWRPALAPIARPAAASFDSDTVKRGAELAAIGNCDVCHTSPGGPVFAGGRAVPTPFGTVYSTNITPDADTGIGVWSEAAFRRAMRSGVRRDGAYLYPAFPYDHFTLVTDDDDRALYAFLMTRNAVRASAPDNALAFPFNIRLLMFGWNLLFLREGPYRADAAHDAAWNRGVYLAEGLGHCGACHTPRNLLGAEERGQALAGGAAEGWTAYALDASSPAPLPWTADALAHYLGQGFDASHGVARGPMAEVSADLQAAPADDVRAIAAYVAAGMPDRSPASARVAQEADRQSRRGTMAAAASADSQAEATRVEGGDEGGAIYAAACAGCHEGPRPMPYGGIDLALSSGVSAPNADNLATTVLYGLPAAEAAHAPIMPGFAAALNDAQVVALARYLRAHFSDRPAWSGVEASVRAARSPQRQATVSPPPPGETASPQASPGTSHEAQRQQ